MSRSLFEYLRAFPRQMIVKSATEVHTPCPFCNPENDIAVEYNGVTFVGENRLVWWNTDNPHVFCRRCQTSGRGRNGVYFVEDMEKLFGDRLPDGDEDLTPLLTLSQSENPPRLEPLAGVNFFHRRVDREFWTGLGFTDETINHFRLGFGRPLRKQRKEGHVIPMIVRTANSLLDSGVYYEVRMRQDDGSFFKMQNEGSKKHLFWHVAEGASDGVVYVVESPKNVLAMWQMGYRHVVCTFGYGVWFRVPENMRYLAEQGYRRVVICGDNDSAGDDMKRVLSEQALLVGLQPEALIWIQDRTDHEGYDVADLMKDTGVEQARQYIRDFSEPVIEQIRLPDDKATYIPNFRAVDRHYRPSEEEVISLDEIRGDGERSLKYQINDFIRNYRHTRKFGKGTVKLIAAPPGAGKTYTLIRTAEQVAKESMERKFQRRFEIEQEILRVTGELETENDPTRRMELDEQRQHFQRLLDAFSLQSVMWSSKYVNSIDNLEQTGAETSMWFDFQARNEDNCQNYGMVEELSKKNHNVMRFCEESCPFAQMCRERGYLSQLTERAKFPIGVYRHEHLPVEKIREGYDDLIVVDEQPLGIVERPLLVAPEEVYPSNPLWDTQLSNASLIEALKAFSDGLAQAIRYNANESRSKENGDANPSHVLSGATFLRLLDTVIQQITNGSWSLENVMEIIDEKSVKTLQPNYVGQDLSAIHPIRLPQIWKAISREIEDYIANPQNTLPSCLHLTAGVLEVYAMEKIHISSNIPIIVADATATLPALYEAAFGRDLDIYAPMIRNPNARVEEIFGSDWTQTYIERSLGEQLRDRRSRVGIDHIRDVYGRRVLEQELDSNPDLYQNSLVRQYRNIVLFYGLKHESLLVVTHKKIRDVVETVTKALLPNRKIEFGHYGALRGTNAYSNFEAVLLIGTPRIPYDVLWRKIQAWATISNIRETIPNELVYVPTPYDGTNEGHTHLTFSHPFAREFVNMVELGEAIQSQERIRPHSTTGEKFIYLWSSRPIGKFINAVSKKTELERAIDPESKANAIATFVRSVSSRGEDVPSKRSIMSLFSCSIETCNQGLTLAGVANVG